MIVTGSSIQFASSHNSFKSHEKTESLSIWDNRPQSSQKNLHETAVSSALSVDISIQGMQSASGEKAESAELSEDAQVMFDLNLTILRAMVERLSGKKMSLIKPSDLNGDEAADAKPELAGQTAASAANGSVGWGLAYDATESHYESETSSFSAAGVIRTADGREISFAAELTMSREYLRREEISIRAGDALKDPLVINFDGNAARLLDRSFAFDLNADGLEDAVPVLAPGSGFLALDRNGDNAINDGSELFGPSSGNGFTELASFDEDGNRFIDENDSVFHQLRLWKPDDGGGEVLALARVGIGAIALDHATTPFSLNNQDNAQQGMVRATGIYLREDGGVGTLQQLDLKI